VDTTVSELTLDCVAALHSRKNGAMIWLVFLSRIVTKHSQAFKMLTNMVCCFILLNSFAYLIRFFPDEFPVLLTPSWRKVLLTMVMRVVQFGRWIGALMLVTVPTCHFLHIPSVNRITGATQVAPFQCYSPWIESVDTGLERRSKVGRQWSRFGVQGSFCHLVFLWTT